MPRQTGKGSRKRKEAAFERNAVQHHQFIGEADAERAEAEFRKHDRLEQERNQEAVREMADELAKVAGVKDGAEGPELRVPRSLEEGKQMLRDAPGMLREAPEMLREKARERLAQLPEPAQKVVQRAEDVAALLFAPVRIGFAVARELIRMPGSLLRVLRQREA